MTFRLFPLRTGLLALLLGLLPLCAPAQTTAEPPAGTLAFTMYPPGNLTDKDVHDALINASIGRGWTIKEDADQKIVIYLLRHKHEATVTFLPSVSKVEAYCEGYATDSKGNRKDPEQPKGWLKYLQEDIPKHFSIASDRNAKK